MMDEVGAQVAPPIFIHQQLSIPKKRDFCYAQNLNLNLNQPHQQTWNPKAWDWDSSRFLAKPLHHTQNQDLDDDRLRLNLGGGFNSVDNSAPSAAASSRPAKKSRSGSPAGGTASYPVCQVDDCSEDLSNAKDYHRRHKVCELHSKSTQALLNHQLQRFCQQCSRFHLLSEFDEGKRSCRRRLAGHNRRRRKTQPEDVTSRLAHPANSDANPHKSLDIVNLLTRFARAQGNIEDKNLNFSSIPDRDQLVHILSKINSLPFHIDLAAKLSNLGASQHGKVAAQLVQQGNQPNGRTTSPSTMDLLAVLSDKACGPDAPASLSCHSSPGTDSQKTVLTQLDGNAALSLHNKPPPDTPSVPGERSSTSYQSHNDDSDFQVQETRPNLPLQLLISSPESDSPPPKLENSRKYFSSDSSNPMEEISPSCSPVVQKLFPLQRSAEDMKSEKMPINGRVKPNVGANHLPLELFKGSKIGSHRKSVQIFSSQAGYTSSGSDHSPPSLNSDAQDRTGRILLKLFDKDPSHLPGKLREQIYNWLSNSPSDMESYIRPGCVVLAIYASMTSAAWEQLEENLLHRVNSLVQDSDMDFWRSGRFLVRIGRQLASHKEGNIHIYKSWRTWSSPELISVSPVAVVSGQVTSFVLRGRNLACPGTKIHFTSMGGYASKEIGGSSSHGSMYDEVTFDGLKIQSGDSGVLGRCFVEVENGFKGNSFPVLVADSSICKELRILESVYDERAKACDVISEDQVYGIVPPRSREEVLHFLNELGWLFQRRKTPSVYDYPDYSLQRFRFVIIFSVERDFCALVKTILDLLVEMQFDGQKLTKESLEMLSELQLLNRAVKRRCHKMVELLVYYVVTGSNGTSGIYLFPPNSAGPGGLTPLHLAASASGADELIDALTDDPQQIGINGWNSLLDASGQSPQAYATMRNNHSYNSLVARKLADRRNTQVSIMVGNETWLGHMPTVQHKPRPKTCAKCAVVSMSCSRRFSGRQSWLHRPYVNSILAIAAVCVCVCLLFRWSKKRSNLESLTYCTA